MRKGGNASRFRPSVVVAPDEWRAIGVALGLTCRETEVVRGVFDGMAETASAAALDISVHTVHSHLQRIYRKTATRNRAALLVHVFTAHLENLRRSTKASLAVTGRRAM